MLRLNLHRYLLLIACLSWMPWLQATAPVILIVGDSLSDAYNIPPDKAWPKLLAEKLKSEGFSYEVINISQSGATTEEGRQRLPSALQQYHPHIVIIGLGSNDGLRGIAIERMQTNLGQMIEQVQGTQARVLLVGFLIPFNYGSRYRTQFEQTFKDLAQHYHIPLVPFLLEKVALEPQLMQADGLHPNVQAQPILLANLWPYLKPLLTLD